MQNMKYKLVETEEELEKAYCIRHEIFVKEQKLFVDSDRDEYDTPAIHIIALFHDEVVGTVRVYEKEKGVWFGSRLAVLEPYRGRVGKFLIEKAVETVRGKQAKQFKAYVQIANVHFFKRCRWRSIGGVIDYRGVPHQLMEVPL